MISASMEAEGALLPLKLKAFPTELKKLLPDVAPAMVLFCYAAAWVLPAAPTVPPTPCQLTSFFICCERDNTEFLAIIHLAVIAIRGIRVFLAAAAAQQQ